jgi:uncharacterized protein (TIGR02466 family)
MRELIQDKDLMVLETLFPTELWVNYDHQCIVNNESLAEIITHRSLNESSRELSNVGGWQSNDDLAEDDQFTDLVTYVTQSFNPIYKHNNYIDGLKFIIVDMWANINKHRDFNKAHLHPNSDWSFTYYVKVTEDSGDIVFCDPRVRRHMKVQDNILIDHSNNSQHGIYTVNPLNGRLVIFPSYLEHYVEPNLTQETRISISGNIRYDRFGLVKF